MIMFRLLFSLGLLSLLLSAQPVIFHNSQASTGFSEPISSDDKISIALISAPKIIGKYSQSAYNVSLATLMSRLNTHYRLKHYEIEDESSGSLNEALTSARQDGMNAIIAPLTLSGAKNLAAIDTSLPIFIPTVHKRDLPSASDNITCGAIDYRAQIEALLPYMSDSIAIFYDNSAVGNQLKADTEEVFLAHKSEKKRVSSYAVDTKGDNIVTHLSKPSTFSKKSIILHIPVVKSAILTAHMTFTRIKERNILSTQINMDPTLLTLTQYQDRKNMILANSLIEFPPAIYESNMLMNNDISFDWINYTTSVGIDYLISLLNHSDREYTMRIINSQVIYPIELVHPKEFGFEPLTSR
ncbi:MAG: hypothetical protein AB7U44_03990 [Sulfuricurvum sp.]